MSTRPLSTRLPEWLDRALRSSFGERDLGPSEGLRQIAEEWWTMETFPALEFRDGPGGRRAALRSGPELWELITVRRGYADDLDRLRDHFAWVDPGEIDQALEYYDRFPDATDRFIAENERLARLLGDPSA